MQKQWQCKQVQCKFKNRDKKRHNKKKLFFCESRCDFKKLCNPASNKTKLKRLFSIVSMFSIYYNALKLILFSGGGRKRLERSCPGSLDLYSLTCKTWEKKCLTWSPQPGHVIITTLIAIIITSLVFPLLLLFNISVLISKAQAGHVIITNLFFIIASLVILVNIIIVVLISTAQAGQYNGLCEQWVCEERPQHYRHPATVSS